MGLGVRRAHRGAAYRESRRADPPPIRGREDLKLTSAVANNSKRAFEVTTPKHSLSLPYAKADVPPTHADPIAELWIDDELGREAFTYRLASGLEGFVHIEQILDYNLDPAYMRDLLLYKLTVQAKESLKTSPLSRREIIRRLGTSPAQFYRLIDQTNYRKSVDKVLELLYVLDCDVELLVRPRAAASS